MRISNTLLFAVLALHGLLARAESPDVCVAVFEQAALEQALIPGEAAGRSVVGAGRLYFHTAPDKRCQLKDIFVITGDRLEAFADFGDYTHVIYWNSTTGAGTAGWVLRSRTTGTRASIAMGPAQQ